MNFDKLANAHRLKEPIREAVRLTLKGLSAYEAAKKTGVTESGVWRALKRINEAEGNCPCCGRKL